MEARFRESRRMASSYAGHAHEPQLEGRDVVHRAPCASVERIVLICRLGVVAVAKDRYQHHRQACASVEGNQRRALTEVWDRLWEADSLDPLHRAGRAVRGSACRGSRR
eukprot:8383824-Prorocentrum_lima.AAC.1